MTLRGQLVFIVLCCVACSSAATERPARVIREVAPTTTTPTTIAPAPTTPPPTVRPEAEPMYAEAALPCELEFRVHTMSGDGGAIVLNATVLNRTDHEISLALPDRCPSGPIDFLGLTPGYDYYGQCASGACPGPRTPRTVTLVAGQTVQIATARLDFSNSCQPRPAVGRYSIQPVPPTGAFRMCTFPTSVEITDAPIQAPSVAPRQRTAQTPPAPSPPPPAPFSSSEPNECRSDGDCVLACPDAPRCCGWPCGCNHAINRAHAEAFNANYARTCDRAPNCPAVGCAYQPASSAACVNNRCVAERGFGL